MKIDIFQKSGGPAKSLRAKLLGIFILFGVVLLGFLWIMQSVLFERYYENSMEKKCRNGVATIISALSREDDLGYQEFCDILGDVSAANDLYIYVESGDGSFALSSADASKPGRLIPDSRKRINKGDIALESANTHPAAAAYPMGSVAAYPTIIRSGAQGVIP